MIHVSGPNGQELQVRLAYERLPNFCYHCCIIVHLVKDCIICLDRASSTGEIPDEELPYGDWLHTHVNAQQS